MISLLLWPAVAFAPSLTAASVIRHTSDPCAAIAGQQYTEPVLALACLKSFTASETTKQNVLAAVSRTLNFFTFEAEQIHSPSPFNESSVNLRAELARINRTQYLVRIPALVVSAGGSLFLYRRTMTSTEISITP